ncbi:MAG: Crp/Fnr family transcriptional regulator [Anaerolineales bacterium]|nr:Crp/Fnr family transcriptional regulator [Anaerolineales bacterium]
MKDQKTQYLNKMDVFQDLSEDDVGRIDRSTTMTTCKPGRVFYAPEETGEVLFLLKQGRVQLYRLSPDGKKLVVAELGPGAIFGEMSLVGQGMHNTFAESVTDCTICVMSRQDVRRLIQANPPVALRFLEAMAHRLQETEIKLEELAFKDIPSRLAGLLLELAAKTPGEDRVTGYTHQDLAEILGTYRETTTQILSAFKSSGWIRVQRKRIDLLDVPALRTLKNP